MKGLGTDSNVDANNDTCTMPFLYDCTIYDHTGNTYNNSYSSTNTNTNFIAFCNIDDDDNNNTDNDNNITEDIINTSTNTNINTTNNVTISSLGFDSYFESGNVDYYHTYYYQYCNYHYH
jgi:hypothetical protein